MGICACFAPDTSNATLVLYPGQSVTAQGNQNYSNASELNYDITNTQSCNSMVIAIFPDGSNCYGLTVCYGLSKGFEINIGTNGNSDIRIFCHNIGKNNDFIYIQINFLS